MMKEDQLHAYVDDALTPAERELVERHLQDNPADAQRVRAWEANNRSLHRLFDPVLEEPRPLHLRVRGPSTAARRVLPIAAALALGVALGYLARPWLAPGPPAAPLIARQAAAAYVAYSPEVRHPVEVGAQDEQHLVAWLSKRLQAPLRVPVLSSEGWQLLGGRLLPPASSSDPAPIALLVYENARGQRLSLLVKREPTQRDTAFAFSQNGPTRVFHWIDGPFGYALAGDVGREELQRLAELTYRQLNP